MKAKFLSIQIPNPCTQNWETMEVEEGSRFCKSCQQSVIDFSTYSNAEIVRFLTNATSNVCGRLTRSQITQLNYHLIVHVPHNSWLKYLGVLAIGTSIFMQSCEQSAYKKGELVVLDKNIKHDKPKLVSKIYGYVINDFNEPVNGSKVSIANTNLFAITDEYGKYEINSDSSFDPKHNQLVVEGNLAKKNTHINYYTPKQDTVKVQFPERMMGLIIAMPPEVGK
jgi:hypothetical protein